LLELLRERGAELRGRKSVRGGKNEMEEKNLSIDLLARGVCRVVPVNGWLKFSLLKFGVIMPFFP